MFNLDPGKLIVIAVVAIVLLGPDRLPQVARQLGGAWRSFNEFRHRMESEVRNSMPDLPPTSEIARLARSPSALLDHLSTMSSGEAPDGSFQPPTMSEGGVEAPGPPPDASTAPPPAPAPIRAERPAPRHGRQRPSSPATPASTERPDPW